MVYGFPGRTYQYLTSYALDYVMNVSNPSKIKMREKSLSIIDATMKSSEKNYIKYAAKQSRISNSYKKWIGQNIGLKENDALGKKLDFERAFMDRAEGNEAYSALLDEFKSLYKEIQPYTFSREMFIELYYMGPEILGLLTDLKSTIILKQFHPILILLNVKEKIFSGLRIFLKIMM